VRARRVQFSDNTVGAEEIAAVTQVLASRWLSVGVVTREFERAFADALGVADAVAVSSGTAALHVALAALGVGPGDEVITPSLSFVAGAAMTLLLGATPVFADVKSEYDLSIDPDAVRALVTSRTRAVIAVHYAGYAADIVGLRAVTANCGIALLEDAAHAPLVRSHNGMLGTFGELGCFSCYATKNLTMGEGGIVVADDAERLAACRVMRSHYMTMPASGRNPTGRPDYDVTGLGMNYRPTEVASAIGMVQLGKLASDRERRRALTLRYRELLAGVRGIVLPFANRDLAAEDSALHLFVVLLPPGIDRGDVREALTRRGVPTSVHYPPTHRFTFYRDRGQALHLPVTEGIARRLMTLPLHARMTEDDTVYVASQLKSALAEVGVHRSPPKPY
jgi:dTDP-4-amino-4,6-dideoxygalactose transaminase